MLIWFWMPFKNNCLEDIFPSSLCSHTFLVFSEKSILSLIFVPLCMSFSSLVAIKTMFSLLDCTIWLRCTMVWFSLCFWCVGFVESIGTVNLQFSSNLETFWLFLYLSLLFRDSPYTYIRPFEVVPQPTDGMFINLFLSLLSSVFYFGLFLLLCV